MAHTKTFSHGHGVSNVNMDINMDVDSNLMSRIKANNEFGAVCKLGRRCAPRRYGHVLFGEKASGG